jgi:hypothetical protein
LAHTEIKWGGHEWVVEMLLVPSEGDWFSDYWHVNRREVPHTWLAKRWSAILGMTDKVVLEYREPLPASLASLEPALLLPDAETDVVLRAFVARADKAFTPSRESASFAGQVPFEPLLPVVPGGRPDAGKLLGWVAEHGRGGGDIP